MLEMLVGQFMKSANGGELLGQLQKQGLSAGQAESAVSATAEGAMQQMGGTENPAGAAAALGGGNLGGALGGMLGGLGAGGAQAPGLGAMTQPVAAFVAKKTGLQPAVAAMVVSAALPKLLEMIKGKPAQGAQPNAGGGIAGALGGLLG